MICYTDLKANIKGPLGKETPYETELSRKVVSKPAKTKEFANLGGSISNYGQCGRQSLPVSLIARGIYDLSDYIPCSEIRAVRSMCCELNGASL